MIEDCRPRRFAAQVPVCVIREVDDGGAVGGGGILDAPLVGAGQGIDDLDLELAVDLGLDLRLTSQFLIRFGGTVGDRDGVAIGLVF